MTADIVKLPTRPSKDKADSKPLTALKVKRHNQGTIADAHPYRGLRLRANKNGTKTWFYRYRLGERIKQIKLGTYPAMSLVAARKTFNEQKALREQHKDPRRVANERRRIAEQKEFTFVVMVDQYLTERVEKDRMAKGANEVRRLLENDLGKLAAIQVDEANPAELHEHIMGIATRAPAIARNFRSELARAWRYAVNTGKTRTPCPINSDTGGQLRQGKRERYLTKAELKLLLPWLHHFSLTVRDALTLTLYLGLRSGEVCRLCDDWLTEETDGWWITIPASEMKKHHSDHRVPLTGKALEIVMSRSGNGYWFPSRTGSCIAQKVLGVEVYSHSGRSSAKIYKNKVACPVSNWAPNDLRKTARTHLAAMGCSFEVAESILHHRIPGVSGLYNRHSYDAEKRDWLTRLGEFYDGLTG